MRTLASEELSKLSTWRVDVKEWLEYLNFFRCELIGKNKKEIEHNYEEVIKKVLNNSSQVIAHVCGEYAKEYNAEVWKKNRNKLIAKVSNISSVDLLKASKFCIFEFSIDDGVSLITDLRKFVKNPYVLSNPKTIYEKSMWDPIIKKVRSKNIAVLIIEPKEKGACLNILASDDLITGYFDEALSSYLYDENELRELVEGGWWGKIVVTNRDIDKKKFKDRYSYIDYLDKEVGVKLRQKKYGDTSMPSYQSPASKLSFYIRYELFEEGMKYLRYLLREMTVPKSTIIESEYLPRKKVFQIYENKG